jgi:hypothetical protein
MELYPANMGTATQKTGVGRFFLRCSWLTLGNCARKQWFGDFRGQPAADVIGSARGGSTPPSLPAAA